jgi:hypothetical protein
VELESCSRSVRRYHKGAMPNEHAPLIARQDTMSADVHEHAWGLEALGPDIPT